MATPPTPVKFDRADLHGAPAWVDDFFTNLNPQLQLAQQALTKGVSLGDNLNAQLVTVTAVGPTPGWLELGTSGAPAFAGAWKNLGAPWETGAIRIGPGGRVELKGWVTGGTGNVFTPPAGYGAASYQGGATEGNSAFATWRLFAGGAFALGTGSGTGFSLNNISWQAAAPAAYPTRPVGSGWPVPVNHGLQSVSALHLVRVEDLDAGTSVPALATASAVEWGAGDKPGMASLLSASGLCPGRKYRLTLLVWR